MLALTDAALAHLAIAATGVDPRHRREWLRDIAATLDPPIITKADFIDKRNRTPAARRQAKVRQRRKNGQHVYTLVLKDRCVEGLIAMMLASGQLTEGEANDHHMIEAKLAALLEEQGTRWTR